MTKISIMFFLLFFSGCSIKEYKLFQKEDTKQVSEPQELNITYSSKIIPNDILEIDIYNMNRKANIMMNDKGYINPDNKYVVYPDGSITLPLLNSIKVQGLTIKELNQDLTSKYSAYLNAPFVKATIKNHKIFVLGEVEKRGVVPIEGETISVIEALAQAGGLTDHAIRDRVRIITHERGKYILHTLNLHDFKTLNSHNLMLTNNTILYIEPKGTKAINVALNDYLPIVKAVSSVLGTFVSIKYLGD